MTLLNPTGYDQLPGVPLEAKEAGGKVIILDATNENMTLGFARNWLRFLHDRKLVLDRKEASIVIRDRALGLRAETRVPFSQVESVKMSVRSGHGYMLIPMVSIMRTAREVQIDLWVDIGGKGKIDIETMVGIGSDADGIAVMGRRIANYMDRPFIDTSR